MSDQHLGPAAAALADGELGLEARERALAHLARCASCRSDVAAQRAVRQRLRGLDAGEPVIPSALYGRLLAVASAVDPLAAAGPVSVPPRASRGGPARYARQVAVASAALGAGLVGVFALGGPAAGAAGPVLEPVANLVAQHDTTGREVPLRDPTISVVSVGLHR